ncbi:MAG: AMP-binding protein [Methylophilus sp.]|nr:AMP-binding protein [Methylophilus sp.]
MQYAVFEQLLARHILLTPNAVAMQGQYVSMSYAQLQQEIDQLRQELVLENHHQPIAVAIANHPAWVLLDLTALGSEIPSVPLPFFFTNAQILHAVLDAGAGTLITDEPERFCQIFNDRITRKTTIIVAGKRLMQLDLRVPEQALPKGTAKITYTSGTTGNPKGVCLSTENMLSVAASVVDASGITGDAKHLCVLPLSTLLENVAGVYAALIAGATVCLLPGEKTGLTGSQLNIQQLHRTLTDTQANTAIFIPELLNALVHTLEAGAASLPVLRFLAVGGAAVTSSLLDRAAHLGLPVYQGYGLSECASVVALNTVQANQVGSVGKPLQHVDIKLADDGEILVKGQHFLGYTGMPAAIDQEWFATGDIGALDAQGFLHIQGRKKNVFITSFGRNVSPEWVECALLDSRHIAQACVFGEAKPWNIALIVTNSPASDPLINQSIAEINQQLPDYARITKWITVQPFSHANHQLTANGRLKRQAIYQAYQEAINHLYKESA